MRQEPLSRQSWTPHPFLEVCWPTFLMLEGVEGRYHFTRSCKKTRRGLASRWAAEAWSVREIDPTPATAFMFPWQNYRCSNFSSSQSFDDQKPPISLSQLAALNHHFKPERRVPTLTTHRHRRATELQEWVSRRKPENSLWWVALYR